MVVYVGTGQLGWNQFELHQFSEYLQKMPKNLLIMYEEPTDFRHPVDYSIIIVFRQGQGLDNIRKGAKCGEGTLVMSEKR